MFRVNALLVVSAFLLLACPGTKTSTCADGCEAGTFCDDSTNLCVKPDGIKCIDGRACAPACDDSTPCSSNLTCQNQRCAPPVASSGQYSACAIDADCARGDFCKLGACAHECVRDSECSDAKVCSSRGRCVTEAQVSQPPPAVVVSKGRVAFEPAALDFTLSANTLKFSLRNLGGDPYDFRILSSQPGLEVTPFDGRVSGQPVEVTVKLDRTLFKSDSAYLAVNTSAGYERIPVQVASKVDGLWSASFAVESPIALGSHVAFFALNEGAAGALTGVVDGERSPLFPLNVPITGNVTPDTASFTFRLVASAGTSANPAIPNVVGREVSVNVKRVGANSMEGTFTEDLVGVATEKLTVSGKVSFARVGPVDSKVMPLPDVPLPSVDVSNPYFESNGTPKAAYNACLQMCPTTNCKSSSEGNGNDIFNNYPLTGAATRDAAKMVDQFSLYSGSDGYDAYYFSSASRCGYPDCVDAKTAYDPIRLGCAQYWYAKDVPAGPAAFMDSGEVVAASALLVGNSQLTIAVDNAFISGNSLDLQAKVFEEAIVTFNAGLYGSGTALGLAHPRVVSLFAANTSAQLLTGSNILKGDRAPGMQFAKTLNAVQSVGFAYSQWAQLLRRQNDDVKARATLRKGALSVYLSTVALGLVLKKSPTTWAVELGEVNTQWQSLLSDLKAIEEGRNFLGFSPNYVPFFWNKDNLAQGSTNFQQLLYLARQNRAVWETSFASAQANKRAFEQSATGLDSEINEQKLRVDTQIAALCGARATGLSTCGNDFGDGKDNASEVAQRTLEIAASLQRVQLVEQQAANVNAEVKIEQDRAAQVLNVRQNLASYIDENGKKIGVNEESQRIIQDIQQVRNQVAGGISGFIGGLTTGNFVGAFSQLAVGINGAIADGIAANAKSDLERERRSLVLNERLQVEYAQQNIELISSAAAAKAKLLQLKTLAVEGKMAAFNVTQAKGRLISLASQATALFAYKDRLKSLNGQKARQSNSFRVLAQKDARVALESQRKALTFAFLASRALAYQLNEPQALDTLWAVREPKELTVVLQDLENKAATAGGAQARVDRLSLRDNILGLNTPVKDAATGDIVTAKQRFKQFLASPQSRDELGRLHLRFNTNSPGSPIFSSALGSDRIVGLRLNVVGDNLGAGLSTATVRLVHGGTSSLRKRTKNASGTAELVDYDMSGKDNLPRAAQVQAGLNAPNGAMGLPENIEFRERSTLATGWELIVDTSSTEPGNVNLNLAGIDDIELIVTHDAYTIQ
jgi:hypothetical protein